jgi:ADP-heptose:LPS heptosyltransferase
MKRILVIQTAFLGDAVLVTAILEKLHAFFPDAAIDLVVRKGNEGLFEGHPFLHELHVWDKRQGKTRALFKLIGALRKTEYDHIINAQRFFSTGLMMVLARGKEKVGYDKNPLSFLFDHRVKHVIGDGRHEVDRLNALIMHLTDGARPLPKLYPTAKAREEVNGHMDQRLRMHRAGIGLVHQAMACREMDPVDQDLPSGPTSAADRCAGRCRLVRAYRERGRSRNRARGQAVPPGHRCADARRCNELRERQRPPAHR